MGRVSVGEAGGLRMASDSLCMGPASTVTDGTPLIHGAAAKDGGMRRCGQVVHVGVPVEQQ